jgi:hypothetical protein
VPALVVGLLVYLLAGGTSDGNGGSAGVLEGLITGGDTQGTASYENELPPGFPAELPLYTDAKIAASFLLTGEQGARYFVILRTEDSTDAVYSFYIERLDQAPWQVEIARSSNEFTGMRFTRPDNPDIQGEMGIHHSNLDDQTTIYLTVDDVAATAAGQIPEEPFVVGASRSLPASFPADIPIYEGKSGESTVVVSQFGRGGGNNNFVISFITRDSQTDVVNFYRQEFQRRGWNVTDSQASGTSFALGIDFNDGQSQQISGTVSADSFEEDASYTRVDMQLQVSARRGRGN